MRGVLVLGAGHALEIPSRQALYVLELSSGLGFGLPCAQENIFGRQVKRLWVDIFLNRVYGAFQEELPPYTTNRREHETQLVQKQGENTRRKVVWTVK